MMEWEKGYDIHLTKPFLQQIKVLQREINKLCDKYQDFLQASATMKWDTESLISFFKEKTFDIKELVSQHLKL